MESEAQEIILKGKQARFVEAYLSDPQRNATKAAIRAGYSEASARTQASRMLKNDNIQQVINSENERRIKESSQNLARLVQFLEICAYTPVTEFLKFGSNGLEILNSGDLDPDVVHCIQEVAEIQVEYDEEQLELFKDHREVQPRGKLRIKSVDKLKAADMLSKLHGWYRQVDQPAGIPSKLEIHIVDGEGANAASATG